MSLLKRGNTLADRQPLGIGTMKQASKRVALVAQEGSDSVLTVALLNQLGWQSAVVSTWREAEKCLGQSHFDLMITDYRKEIDAQVALAATLLAEQPPLKAFRMWCDRLAKFGRLKYGVADIIHAATSEQTLQETYFPMLDAVRQLMKACESSGEIRPGANAEDFLMLAGLLWRIPPNSAGEARVKRLLALAFRGLGAEDT